MSAALHPACSGSESAWLAEVVNACIGGQHAEVRYTQTEASTLIILMQLQDCSASVESDTSWSLFLTVTLGCTPHSSPLPLQYPQWDPNTILGPSQAFHRLAAVSNWRHHKQRSQCECIATASSLSSRAHLVSRTHTEWFADMLFSKMPWISRKLAHLGSYYEKLLRQHMTLAACSTSQV